MALIELKNVSKDYGDSNKRTEVLRNVSLSVEEGESVAIVGYSGAGKRTLLSILAGLIRPESGTATFRGQPIVGPSPERGVVFQSYSLLPWLTAFENVMLAVRAVFPSWSAAQQRAKVEKFLS